MLNITVKLIIYSKKVYDFEGNILQEWFIILLPAFFLGMLHTAIPCEDKAIFCFWSFGISKNLKNSIVILILYGLGLMTANLSIAGLTILISLIPRVFGFVPDPYAINFFGAFSSTFAAIFFLFFVTRKNYMPHSKIRNELLQLDWKKYKTPYVFGLLAGFPPCVFEMFIYAQCLTYSLSYGFMEGWFTVFYFSLGTFIGLFVLAVAKHGTTQIIKTKDPKRNRIFFVMIFLIICFNIIVMILSFLRIHIFPVENL